MRTDLPNLIDSAAYIVLKRYRGFVEAEDIRQEMWAWILGQDQAKVDLLESHTLTWKLRDAGEVYARKEKAALAGYTPDDEVFYSVRTLREMLPLAITTDPVVLGREGEDNGKPSGYATWMDFETALADVRKAYRRISVKYRQILAEYVVDPLMADDIAVTRALRFMQRKLGGKRPRREKI